MRLQFSYENEITVFIPLWVLSSLHFHRKQFRTTLESLLKRGRRNLPKMARGDLDRLYWNGQVPNALRSAVSAQKVNNWLGTHFLSGRDMRRGIEALSSNNSPSPSFLLGACMGVAHGEEDEDDSMSVCEAEESRSDSYQPGISKQTWF
jgi:hypothetical protein